MFWRKKTSKEKDEIKNLTEEEEKRYTRYSLIDIGITMISCLTVFFAIFLTLRVGTVPSGSMYPTLQIKELCLIRRIYDPVNDLDYGDIVTFMHHSSHGDSQFIKRLMGKPGDTIEVTEFNVIRNGEVVDKSYRAENYTILTQEPITLGENEYFFMGDNWNNSSDCRVFGPVLEEDIIGRVFFHTNFFEDPECDTFMGNVFPELRNPDFTGEYPEYIGPDYEIPEYHP